VRGGKRPVIVWLHGGGYATGSAGLIMYDGANFSRKQDAVFVGVNHRLNVFGYLYLSGLGGAKYAQSSNVGQMDIVAALEWVRGNIARFGGDSNNVTICGPVRRRRQGQQSAGDASGQGPVPSGHYSERSKSAEHSGRGRQ
jgi:carboxylesterase type B